MWNWVKRFVSKSKAETERIYKETPSAYWSDDHELHDYKQPISCSSMICNRSFWDMPFFEFWAKKTADNFKDLMKSSNQLTEKAFSSPVVYHRKQWEFVYICQALYERGLLIAGKRGVGFGVGTECLPAVFASYGCEILATDLSGEDATNEGWKQTAQNMDVDDLKALNKYGLCEEEKFFNLVRTRNVDMNDIPVDIEGYDFCWSACALEHLGSIQHGLDFIENSLRVLKQGGVAVHTTEFNLSSEGKTFESPIYSLYRRCDIENLVNRLEANGHSVEPLDFHKGTSVLDNFIDLPPYSSKDMHLRLELQGFPCTSIGLIIRKG